MLKSSHQTTSPSRAPSLQCFYVKCLSLTKVMSESVWSWLSHHCQVWITKDKFKTLQPCLSHHVMSESLRWSLNCYGDPRTIAFDSLWSCQHHYSHVRVTMAMFEPLYSNNVQSCINVMFAMVMSESIQSCPSHVHVTAIMSESLQSCHSHVWITMLMSKAAFMPQLRWPCPSHVWVTTIMLKSLWSWLTNQHFGLNEVAGRQ